jgi:hypothetical protein
MGTKQATINYADARNDAGLLREFIAERYGYHFDGAYVHPDTHRRAYATARRLAAMLGTTVAAVVAQAVQDFADMSAMETA